MTEFQLIGIGSVSGEPIEFGVEDIETLYVTSRDGSMIGTFVKPETLRIVTKETPVTVQGLLAIGFTYADRRYYQYKDNSVDYIRVTYKHSQRYDWWLTVNSQNFALSNMEQLQAILEALFWIGKDKQ